ncbi:hypothetical protein P153DRAFT_369359 [Dothidotthia symphoricarpi CBS 119687]|uniref:Uncharacterized protein n=1 Tax=Dothidotthia symphoricarpi CBS 119687 TaxID=1392245 RepID=A0A6A6A1W3_9PLEO|nr:uncharacterized protein P153DRAFT_369359 [Dothidotthia symphoricarpi CBS 119687]KAF2125972.1 hypothetical protein P153DRAFT_369359 [Dothidotthia symphoricarpi CBS 119687]
MDNRRRQYLRRVQSLALNSAFIFALPNTILKHSFLMSESPTSPNPTRILAVDRRFAPEPVHTARSNAMMPGIRGRSSACGMFSAPISWIHLPGLSSPAGCCTASFVICAGTWENQSLVRKVKGFCRWYRSNVKILLRARMVGFVCEAMCQLL